MPRITLPNLPVEIHLEIFKYALYSAQEADYGECYYRPCLDESDDDNDDDIIGWKWIEDDRRKLSQFPYNAAAVCKLWHAVLTKIPECWTRVIIDVATDPRRFLDIFLWSKHLPKLEVTIFNSHTPDAQDVDYSSLERERVSAIVDALRPHVSRCKFITFDVVFLTSLPSPVIFLLESAPHLENLILECKINDAGSPKDYSRACDIGVRRPIQTPSLFPEFKSLSLTGFWFMFVAGHPYTSEWFEKIAPKHSCSFSQFQFQQEGQYTIQNFVSYCSAFQPRSLTLSDLSLNHDVPIPDGYDSEYEDSEYDDSEYDTEVFSCRESVVFKNVSADVIKSLFFQAQISPDYLTFDNCAFPDEKLSSGARELILKNIPYSFPANSGSRKKGTNLARILEDWTGTTLTVVSCPSFDDKILSVLPGYEDSILQCLYLHDCDNFTVRGIRRYLKRRNKCLTKSHSLYEDEEDFRRLEISGTTCAFPSKEDKKWFHTSECAEPIYIDWQLQNPKNFRDVRKFLKTS